MTWDEIRNIYPDTWLIVEALEANTGTDHRRMVTSMAVVERCLNGNHAF